MEQPPLPRVTIQFCTQCKWMLRASYFAQELLSTFSTSLGEVALQPSTGGTFIVHLYHASGDEPMVLQKHLLWDRKSDGGFPETKELKRRVRDIIDPSRNLGHIDNHKKDLDLDPDPDPDPEPELPSKPQPHPIPQAIRLLQTQAQTPTERKFTPMDVDVAPQRDTTTTTTSTTDAKERWGEEAAFCRPGDEDCG